MRLLSHLPLLYLALFQPTAPALSHVPCGVQSVLCFTTLLDSDLRTTSDTSFTVLRAKVCMYRGMCGCVCCHGHKAETPLGHMWGSCGTNSAS